MIHQGEDDLAVGVGLELCLWPKGFAQSNMVVNFTVDGENDFSIVTDQGLCASVFEMD
jgi:hypothetical protein